MRRLDELSSLAGRTALVTGAAGHVGLAAGQALVELGATVAVVDLDKADCEARAEELTMHGRGSAFALACDLADEDATRDAVAAARTTAGGIDVVVCCAAYTGASPLPGWVAPFAEQTVEAWDAAVRVNLTSAFVVAQAAAESLAASGRGSVIFIASTYGLVGPDMRLYEGTTMGNPAGYAASKGGLLQLSRYLATVLAPAVRVNAITPGGIERGQPDSFRARYVERTPLARMAREEDLKGAVAYLASDLSSYVTGHNLVVDGGWTAW